MIMPLAHGTDGKTIGRRYYELVLWYLAINDEMKKNSRREKMERPSKAKAS